MIPLRLIVRTAPLPTRPRVRSRLVLPPVAVRRKLSYKTTEFMVYVVAVVGVLIASFLVDTTDAHEDYFRADRAWFYIVLLTIGYMVSRGLAKAGSRHHDDA